MMRWVILCLVAGSLGCQPTEHGPAPEIRELPPTLAGFRADAWYLPDDDLLGFVGIPAGPFVMGSDVTVDNQAFENERWSPQQPQGIVSLPDFYISRFEVTVAQYAAFVADTGIRVSDQVLGGVPDHPVGSVSWPDTLAYCRWLDRSLRNWVGTPAVLRDLLRNGWRVTLPNEAEWEKAARGADGRVYPWGNDPRAGGANYDSSGPRPVGSIPCSECPFELSDMAGNVWELTRSRYLPYPFSGETNSSVDPASLSADALFVMRGGSYMDRNNLVRTATRGGADPGVRRPFIGFRVVITRF